MKWFSDQEVVLLERWKSGDENALKTFLEPHLARIYPLALFLNGGDKEKAYFATYSAFVETLHVPSQRKRFLFRVAAKLIPISRKQAASFSESNGLKRVFQSLDFDTRALLLLRYQINLTYDEISRLLQIPKKSVRIKIIRARELLKEKVQGTTHA